MPAADNYTLLIAKVNTFIRKYYLNQLLRGLILLGAGLFTAYLTVVLTEYAGNFNTTFRSALFYGFIVINTVLLLWLVMPPLLAYLRLGTTLTHEQAAEIIGEHFAHVKDKLLNTLQLKQLANQDVQHRQLIEASINQKIEDLKPVSFPSAINFRANTRYIKWVGFPAAVIIIIALAAPSILTESTKRIIRHNEYFAPKAPFRFVVVNPNMAVTQGEDFTLKVKLQGNRLPADVYVETTDHSFKLTKENISQFSYLFSNMQQNTRFRLSASGFSSPLYEVKVNYKPALLHFTVRLAYPSYLHKKNEVLTDAGELNIPAGTIATWQVSTKNADAMLFKLNGAAKQAKIISSNTFEHTERILKSTSYSLVPLNKAATRSDSAAYTIHVIADELPEISVQLVKDSVSMKALYFNGSIRDDHGFSALNFYCSVTDPAHPQHKTFVRKSVKADLSKSQANFFYYLNIADLPVKAGDNVSYYFEVADNDAVNGNKRVRSQEFNLQVPDAQQLNQQLNAGTQAVKQKMQSAIKLAAQLERETQQANQLLFNKSSLSFDEKKQLENLMQKRKELNDLVKEIQQENKKNSYNRQESQQQNEELTTKQKEMEQLLNQVTDNKTQDMLKKLEELLQQNQKEDTRQELSNMQADNQSMKKDLNRMLELYKKLDFDQKLNQNINQLNQLAQQQQQLSANTKEQNNNPQQLKQQQEQIKKNFEEVKKNLTELEKTNEQLEQKTSFKNPEQQSSKVEQQMDKSSEQLQKNNRQNAAQAQQQAAQQLQQIASNMKQQNEESEQQQSQFNLQQLRELVKNLVNSSFEQEKLMQRLRGISANDPAYTVLAQKQKDIKDNLKTAEDSLYSLSRKIPQIQSAVNQEVKNINDHINEALTNMDDRRTPEVNYNQQYAMTSMNNLALMLSEVIDQVQRMMKNAKPGSGKKQSSMSQLSQQQQQLNQNMQRMRDQLQQQGNQGKSAQGSQSEQLARMARQQALIRQALEKYSRENQGKNGADAGKLNKIARDMEQTENDLVNKKVTNESLLRQQQIQARLLEADKAEQERGKDQQRESNAGKSMPPGYIKALQTYQQQKAKQTEQLQTVSPALNLYFKEKVKTYFDQLNAH